MICVAPCVAVKMHADVDKGGGADRHQHVRAQAAAALPILPLRADQRAEHKGAEQAYERVEKSGKANERRKAMVI